MWLTLMVSLVAAFAVVVHQVLYRPWRVKPLHRMLAKHSSLYRRWLRHRFVRAFKKTERVIGKTLLPVIEKTAQALREWSDASSRV